MIRAVLVTGASSGIGRAIAEQLAKDGGVDRFYLVARSEERLRAVTDKLPVETILLPYDLSDVNAPLAIRKRLEADGVSLSYLIAAAGCGKIGDVREIPTEDNRKVSELNVTATFALITECLPLMAQNSHILAVASAAAFLPQPGFAVYAASKAAVLSFCRALRVEEAGRCSVTALCPGPVDTDFFCTAEEYVKMPRYKQRFMISPEKAACAAIRGMRKNRAVVTPGFSMTAVRVLSKILPTSLCIGGKRRNP